MSQEWSVGTMSPFPSRRPPNSALRLYTLLKLLPNAAMCHISTCFPRSITAMASLCPPIPQCSLRQRRTLQQKYLRALICSIVSLSPNCATNNQNIYLYSRTSLVQQGPTAAMDTHSQTAIAHAMMKETEIIRRVSSTLTMKAVTANAQ